MNPGEKNINCNHWKEQYVSDIKDITQAFFDEDGNYFYFFTYNDITDFSSGYSYSTESFTSSESDLSISIKINSKSPLSFIDNVEIKEMEFIRRTKYRRTEN